MFDGNCVAILYRAFTGVELRKKLIAKNFSVNVVETVLSEFQDRWVTTFCYLVSLDVFLFIYEEESPPVS